MKPHYGNYLGIVINNKDPETRGRVQVFVPHIMPALYKGWNEQGQDISISCVGDNIENALSSDIISTLTKILPWAEAASPIIGNSAPGNLTPSAIGGMIGGMIGGAVAGAAGQAIGQAAGQAIGGVFNQEPTTKPDTSSGGATGGLIDRARSITGLAMNDAAKWGMCARGTTGLDKAAGLIDNTGASAGFGQAADLTTTGTYNPYTTGEGAKNFNPPFKVDPTTYKPQIGDSVYCSGGRRGSSGQFLGHAQKCIGFKPDGTAIWHSDKPQSKFFTNTSSGPYSNFTVYRLNDAGLAKYKAAAGISGDPSSTTQGNGGVDKQTAESANPAVVPPTTNPEGQTPTTAPVPQTGTTPTQTGGLVAGAPGTGTPAGTVSGGGTATTTTGNTQVRNFSGTNAQAYATARAAAAAAGSPDPDVTASIAMFESGHLGSSMSKRANNPFGQTITRGQAAALARGESIGNGIIGSTTGRDGQPHAVYDSLESAMKHHVSRWGSKYASGSPGETVNNMVAGGYNTESLDGLPPGQYWKNGVLGRYNKLSGQTAQPVEGLAGTPPTGEVANSQTPSAPSVVNNTDPGGPTSVVNTNDSAKGLFAYPNPGAMVWVFFREGNPLYPVYFAASYSASEWSSAYRGASESDGYANNGSVISTATHFNPNRAGGLTFNVTTDLTDPSGLQDKASVMLYGDDGSNMMLAKGQHQIYTRHNRRDQVDRDRFETTMGFKEQWVEGDYSINVRGNYILKIGKIDQESMDALQKLADYSSQINSKLTSSSGG